MRTATLAAAAADVILPRWNAVKLVTAIVTSAHFAPQLVDHDESPGEGLTVAALRDRAAQRGPGLSSQGGWSRESQDDEEYVEE